MQIENIWSLNVGLGIATWRELFDSMNYITIIDLESYDLLLAINILKSMHHCPI